jgi:hypothetical protein
MGFWSAILGGSNPTLNNDISQLGQLSGFSQGIGQGDTTAASNYYRNILSGDPALEAKSLAPQISAQQGQEQQARNSLAQFGNRSGGTGAAQQAIGAQGRGNIINALGGLQQGAAGGLANIGQSNLGLAASDTQAQAGESQQRLQNYMNSILGKGISSGVGALESYGLGGLGGVPGGGGIPALPGVGSTATAPVLPGAISGGYAGATPAGIASNSVPLSQIFG